MNKKYLIFYLIFLLSGCNNKNFINWYYGSLEEAIALNLNNNKLIMIDFYTDW